MQRGLYQNNGIVFPFKEQYSLPSLFNLLYPRRMDEYTIRVFGDPVLKKVAEDVENIDGTLVRTCERMLETMYGAPGIGLAAPQVGISQRFFVYDYGDGPKVLINPVVRETEGEWEYEEGCLSVPGLSWDIIRPKVIHLTGYDLDGNELSIEADELESRLYQHEMDHLDGKLLLEYLEDDQQKEAKKFLRQRMMEFDDPRGLLTLRRDTIE